MTQPEQMPMPVRVMKEAHEPTDWPQWLTLGRQVIIFLLGVAVIAFAATSPGHDVTFIVTGLILIGMIPIENLITRLMSKDQKTE